METVPYMEKGIVIPVHNVVLLSGVSTMIYYSQASVQLQEALRQEDAKFVVLPLKRDLAIGDITAEDFHRYGVMFTSGRLASNEKGTYLSARLMNRVRVENTYQEDGSVGLRSIRAIRNRWIWMSRAWNRSSAISGRP